MGERSATRYRTAEVALWREHGAVPDEDWIDVPGHGVRVRVLVTGHGPPVLFVHGITTAGSLWAPLAGRLPGHRCIVLDRPGCGLSEALPASEAGSFSALVDVQLAVLDALGVDAADVVGSSLGGAAVLALADRAPDRVRRIVLEGAPALAGIRLVPAHRLLASGALGRFLARLPMSAATVRWYFGQLGHRDLRAAGRSSATLIDWARSSANDTDTQRNDVAWFQAIASRRGFRSGWLFDPSRLARIAQPTSWLWGSRDPLATVEQGRAWAAAMADAAFEVVDGGHAPWLDDPGLHARRIDAFLGPAAGASLRRPPSEGSAIPAA